MFRRPFLVVWLAAAYRSQPQPASVHTSCKTFICCLLLSLSGVANAAASTVSPTPQTTQVIVPLRLSEAQRIAESRAPQLAAAQAQESAARDMAIAAGQLPDPVLKLGVSNVPISGEMAWSLTQDSMTMRQVAVMQEFTRGAKRQARSERALSEASVAVAMRRQALAATRRDTALAWLDVAYQDSLRQLVEAQLEELQLQQQTAETAFRAGRGPQADILANRLAIARTRDQLAQMQRDIVMARARLARWIGDEAQRPVGILPDDEHLSWQPEVGDDALRMHPALAAQHGMVTIAEADAKVAEENRKPDIAVELMYSQRGPSYANMMSLNVSMPLPWDRGNRQDRELTASLARADAARATQEDMLRAYRTELTERLTAWQADSVRRMRYDKDLLPLAAGQVDAALAAYRAGTGTLDRVLEARRVQLDTRMERQRVALEVARSWAQLNFLNPRDGDDHAGQGVQP